MRTISIDEANRLVQTLDASSNKYYVYMLCKNGKDPFYVGKGCGLRVLAHQNAAEMASVSIESDDLLSEEQKKQKRDELKEKLQAILDAGDDFEMVIVKWGLSSYEAFMCESALINAFTFAENSTIPKLTNIVNGHASKPEKNSVADIKTKARTIDMFLNECAIPKVDIGQIQEKVAFIKINRLYLDCVDKITGVVDRFKVKECVRGVWSIHASKRDKVEYIFALYRARIVGVFHVVSVSETIDLEFASGLHDFPEFPVNVRIQDRLMAQYSSVADAQHALSRDEFNIFLANLEKKENKDPDDVLKDFRRRIYFVVDDNVPERLKEYEDCLITNEDGAAGFLKSQWPVHCNF